MADYEKKLEEETFKNFLKEVLDETIEVQELENVLTAGIVHNDGMLRMRSMEHVVDVAVTYSFFHRFSKNFYLKVFMPNLAKISLYWRLIKVKRIDRFIQKLSRLYCHLKSDLNFFREILVIISTFEHPISIFYNIRALRKVEGILLIQGHCVRDFELMQLFIEPAQNLAVKEVKVNTFRLLIEFFARVSDLSTKVLLYLADCISEISTLTTEVVIAGIYTDIYKSIRLFRRTPSVIPVNAVISKERVTMYWMVEEANADPLKPIRLKNAQKDASIGMYNLLLKMEKPDRLQKVVQSSEEDMYMMIAVATDLTSSQSKLCDFYNVRTFYIPIFKKHLKDKCAHVFHTFLQLFHAGGMKKKPVDALCFFFMAGIFEGVADKDITDEMRTMFVQHFRNNRILKQWDFGQRTPEGFTPDEIVETLEELHALQIKMFTRMTEVFEKSESIVETCLEILRNTKSMDIKRAIFSLFAKLIGSVSKQSVLQIIDVCSAAVNQELAQVLNTDTVTQITIDYLAIAKKAWKSDKSVEERCINIARNHLLYIYTYPTIGVLYVNALVDTHLSISLAWAPLIIELTLLTPKADMRLFECELLQNVNRLLLRENYVEEKELTVLDELLPRTRYKACVLVLKLLHQDKRWTNKFLTMLVLLIEKESEETGRKAAELLLMMTIRCDFSEHMITFCCKHIADKDVKQFLKTPLECLVARICMRSPELVDKFLSSDIRSKFSKNKTIPDWIETLMLVFRSANGDKEQLAMRLYRRMTPLRNAPSSQVRVAATAASFLLGQYLYEERLEDIRFEVSDKSKEFESQVKDLIRHLVFGRLRLNESFSFDLVFYWLGVHHELPPTEVIPVPVIAKVLRSNTEFCQQLAILYRR